MPKFLSSYTPAPGEQVDMTELAKARVKNRRDEALRLRTFGFQGANVTRLNSDWWRSPQSADSELRYALRNLRFRCRDLERNNDWFRKLLSLFEDNVVSSVGIRLQMKIYDQVQDPATKEIVRTLDSRSCELIEAAWKEQCEGRNYTVTRKLSDIAADKLTMRSIVRDGDILHRKVRGYDNKFKYAIEILEADYLDDFYSDSRTLWNGNQVRMGVEVNEWKCPEAYWLLVNHPGDFNFGVENQAKRIRIEADEIIHPYVIERPEQSRGYPWGVAAMNRLNMLGGYEEAELVAARLAACKGGFYETDRPQIGDQAGGYQGELTDQRVPLEQMEPGINETLPIGMKFKPNDPQHPNANFPAFSQQQLRAAASSVGVSYVSLANDLTGVNFSSIRAGLLDERETYKGVQNFYIQDVKNPTFEDWLEWVLMNGFLGITLRPKDFDYLNQKIFKARRWDWVDPLKDINAAITAIEGGLDTRSNVIGGRGGDYEDVMNELHYEKGFEENLDLDFSGAQPASDKGSFPDDAPKGGDEDDADVKKTKELQALLIGRKQRLNDADNPRILALEKRIETILEKLEERANPKHAEQPRHPESGQWIETEKKVDTLLELFQNLIAGKSALPLQQITNPPQLPIPDPGDIRAMIETSIKSINYNELGRQIALSQTNRPWTAEEVTRHAAAIERKGCRGPFGRSLGLPKGCVMADLSEVDATPILDYQKNIKPEDLAEDGLEKTLHVTALYGFTETDPKPVIKVCKKFGPLTATLGLIEAFENEEYDVLKITVDSSDLAKLNAALKKLPHENDYPEWKGHITIAYLKPGTARAYVGGDVFKDKVLTFNQVVYSDANKVKMLIELPGKNSAQS